MSIFTTEPKRKDGDREVSFIWELGPTTNFHGEPATAIAELAIFHDRNSKRFLAAVMRVDLSATGGRMFTIGRGTHVSLPSIPCARYSAKALDAAVVASTTELLRRKDEPAFVAVADPNSPA